MDTLSDLASLLTGESERVEWKTSLADSKRIIETIAAMASGAGGAIVVGVRDQGQIVGADVARGHTERLIQQILAATDPKVYVHVDRPRTPLGALLVIRVPQGDGPHLAFGRAFVRVGPATVAMSRDQYERRLIDRLRESSGFERRAEPGIALADLDGMGLTTFVAKVHATGRQPLIGQTPVEVLRGLHLGDAHRMTTAAVLLFAHNPQGPFPQATIRCRAQRGASRDEAAIEGPLFQQIEQAAVFVARNLRTLSTREGLLRKDLPELPFAAVREAITNAVAHRDYRSTAPIQLRLDDSGLEIWNPGHLPAPLSAAALHEPHPSVPTNPLIARALYLAGYVEEWGSGTLRIIQALRDAGLGAPLFCEESGGIRVLLPLPGSSAGLLPRQASALKRLSALRGFTNADYARRAEISPRTANADLSALADRGLVRREGRGRSTLWRKIPPASD